MLTRFEHVKDAPRPRKGIVGMTHQDVRHVRAGMPLPGRSRVESLNLLRETPRKKSAAPIKCILGQIDVTPTLSGGFTKDNRFFRIELIPKP